MNEVLKMVETLYAKMAERSAWGRTQLGRPLAFAEKILLSHLFDESPDTVPERMKTYATLRPDRVALQDATAQMALLQFMHAKRPSAAAPSAAKAFG